jgi:hypothetical protein
MANELKITDVVDQKAITQLQNLKKEIDESYTSYKNFIELLAKGMQDKPASFQDLSNKSANYNKVLNELITTQNKLADLQKEHETLLQRIVQQTKENVMQILAEAKANDLNATAELKAQKAKTEELKQQKLINQESRNQKVTEEQIAKALSEKAKSARQAAEQNRTLRKAVKDVDLTEQDAIQTIEKYNKKIEENEEIQDRVSDKMTLRKRGIGDYYNSIINALNLNKGFGSSLTDLASDSDGIAGFMDNIKKNSLALGSTIKTLFTNPAFLSIAGAAGVGTLFKFWYDYNSGIVEATRLTAQFTGKSGDDLKVYRSEVQTLADYYGKDFKETLMAVNSVSEQFGITSEKALEIVKDGFIAGADANGQFLDNLKEYPAYFKEAGISADQFIAIIAETNKQGIFSDKGIDTIKEGNIRLREMTKATASALDGIGISSKKVQEELRKGSLTTFDVMQMVSEKLNELPESSSVVGTAIADIFGGPGEDAGLKYIKTLKDISSNLDEVKDKAGELGKTEEDLIDSQIRLSKEIALLFDKTGGSFEGMTSKVRIFVNEVLADLVKNVRELNESASDMYDRKYTTARKEGRENGVEAAQKEYDHIQKLQQMYVKQGFSENEALEKAKKTRLRILKQALKEESEALQENKDLYDSAKQSYENYKSPILFGPDYGSNLKKNEMNEALDEYMRRLSIVSSLEAQISGIEKYNPFSKEGGEKPLTKDELEKQQREAEKARKELLRIQQEYQQSELDLMDEGLGKELAAIRLNYRKRIDAVKGYSQEEIKTRENLTIAMEDELSEKIYTYNQNKEKINLQNRLEALSTNSKDELDQRLSIQLQVNEILRDAEVKAAKKAGEDVEAVNKKYDKKASDIAVKNALERIGLIEKNTTRATNVIQNAAENDLRKEELRYRKGEINEKEYRQKVYEITKDSIQEQLKLLNIQLQAELAALDPTNAKSDEIKKKIETVKAEIKKLNNEIEDLTYGKEKSDRQDWADGFIDAMSNMKGVAEDYLGDTVNLFSSFYNIIGKLTDEFVETGNFSLSKWWENLDPKEKAAVILETYASLFDGITSIVTSAFDARIEQIEEEQEKNEEAGEEELERIEDLAESGAISTEEAEARKRAAEDRTAQRDKELEKQKAELKQKQARWDKANSIIQATIATALAVTKALPNFVLAAIVGALGAAQIAMIAAQPIPKYAKGTDNHPGGLAIVGDGGRQEVIETDNGAYITPSVPTLVDIPKRAKVIPNLVDYRTMALHSDALMLDRQRRSNDGEPVVVNVNNDYRRLERNTEATNEGIAKLNRTFRKMAKASEYHRLANRI